MIRSLTARLLLRVSDVLEQAQRYVDEAAWLLVRNERASEYVVVQRDVTVGSDESGSWRGRAS